MKLPKLFAVAALGLSLSLSACSGDKPTTTSTAGDLQSSEPASAVAATGEVIEVKMITDDKGNYFEPSEITANQGDILRFTLVTGVHNASFPASENPGVSGLPEASPYLQLAGQTHDVVVDLPAGEYTFQCDPHVALGMKGTLTVQ